MAGISLRSVNGIGSGRDGKEVIKNLSLEIGDRESVVLTGPSRCGITSVIRLIAGLDRVSGGEIWIGDRCVNDLAPKQRDAALVPQNYVPYPRMTVRENLAFALALRKRPETEIKKRVSAASELIGLQELLEHKPEFLSVEQRQRLAIARAVAVNPKVLLFDDALWGLDEPIGRPLRNEITKLHQRLQVTMIYGTHSPVEALAMGGRLVVMKDGVIEQAGPALALYQDPTNAFVAEFIARMNLIAGTLKQERDSWVFVERDQGSMKLRLLIREPPKVEALAEGSVLLGVHPEEIELDQSANASGKEADSFPAIIDHVELMASAANLYLNTGAHSVVCRVQPMSAADVGRRAQFRIRLDRIRLYDALSGQKIV